MNNARVTSAPGMRQRPRWPLALFALAVLLGVCTSAAAGVDDRDGVLQARIDASAETLQHEKYLKFYDAARRRDIARFIAGNMMFVLLHEVGHALITEMGLPVLGREEDAADSFASVAMLWMKDEFSHRVLTEAATGWFYADRRDRMEKTPVTYYDEHGLNQQRAYQIVCYMVGSDPEKFAALADEAGLPKERRTRCVGDFSNAEWSWNMLLKKHRRTTEPKTIMSIVYGEAGAGLEDFAQFLRGVQMLELAAERISDTFIWRAPITLEAKTCGSSGADWNVDTRTLSLCYEMLAEFATLYSNYGAEALPLWR